MKTALLFSGQGEQRPGMMGDLIDAYPAARELFRTASALLGRDIYALTMEGTQEELDQTENTQPCLLACELAAFRVYKELGLPYDAVAGFSLGEWAALSAAGSASEETVIQMIVKRAAAMQEAVPPGEGTMAVILGKDQAYVEELCRSAGGVSPANYNCPGNITVSGTTEGVGRLLKLAEEQGIITSKLPISVPSHCALMEPAVKELRPFVQAVSLCEPKKEFVMNAVGRPVSDSAEIRENLMRQLVCPVLFQQSMELLLSKGYNIFVEIGPSRTLSNMIKRTAKAAKIAVKICQFNCLKSIDNVRSIVEKSK